MKRSFHNGGGRNCDRHQPPPHYADSPEDDEIGHEVSQ
jgi:hypothetical protein